MIYLVLHIQLEGIWDVPAGIYKASFDVNTNKVSLQATTFNNSEYEINDAVAPYELTLVSSQTFVDKVNSGIINVSQIEYKKYFYDLINTDTVDANEVIAYATEYVASRRNRIHEDGHSFDNTKINFINTANVVAVNLFKLVTKMIL